MRKGSSQVQNCPAADTNVPSVSAASAIAVGTYASALATSTAESHPPACVCILKMGNVLVKYLNNYPNAQKAYHENCDQASPQIANQPANIGFQHTSLDEDMPLAKEGTYDSSITASIPQEPHPTAQISSANVAESLPTIVQANKGKHLEVVNNVGDANTTVQCYCSTLSRESSCTCMC